MKIPMTLTLLALFLACVWGQEQSRIQVVIPTAEDETAYVWRTLQNMPFFRQNNYDVNLPDGTFMEYLILKSEQDQLSDDDYTALLQFMKDSIYQASAYAIGCDHVRRRLALLDQMVATIAEFNFNWKFRLFDTYQVNLTLYGPGGSYNPDDGSILLYTTPDGGFKNYRNPANTIIHEITHIGIEESIIGKYQVPHAMKERIVDNFVMINFNEELPQYRVQNMGDLRVDPYMKTVNDLQYLDQHVAEIMQGLPRN